MRTGNLENTRSKSKKSSKIHLKPKSKSNLDEIDDQEAQLLSPVERVKVNHLATTPITPAGNIVDMQGSLNQITPDKVNDDNSDNKSRELKSETSKDDSNKDSAIVESSQKESNLSNETDASRNESENKVVLENNKELQSPGTEIKQLSEGQTEVNQLDNKVSSPVSDSSTKQNLTETQGSSFGLSFIHQIFIL